MEIVEHDRRPHHYRFAHKVLVGLTQDLGPGMLDTDPAQGWTTGFVNLWNQFGERLPAEERLPSDGLKAELITLGAHRLLVIVMPPPIARAEAYYTAVVQPSGSDQLRYFTMEFGLNPLTGEPYTVLGEWTNDSHVSYGPGPEPSLSAFLTALAGLLDRSEKSGTAPDDAASQRTAPQPQPQPEPQAQARAEAQPDAGSERRGLRKLFGR